MASVANSAERARLHAAAAEALAGEIERAQSELGGLEAQAAAAAARLSAGDARTSAKRAKRLAEAQAAYRSATSEVAGAEARLHTLEELEANLEGHVPGTRAVLEESAAGRLGGIVGVVSNLVRVEERYARALDIAFGPALSNIVTATSEDAERSDRIPRVARTRARDLLTARHAGEIAVAATPAPFRTPRARSLTRTRSSRRSPNMPGSSPSWSDAR